MCKLNFELVHVESELSQHWFSLYFFVAYVQDLLCTCSTSFWSDSNHIWSNSKPWWRPAREHSKHIFRR